MIGIGSGAWVLVATKPVDFRGGADGLAALAKGALGQDPFSGTVIVFRARRADPIKIIARDGSGLAMLWKSLDEGAFKWPPISEAIDFAAGGAARRAGLDTDPTAQKTSAKRRPMSKNAL